MSLGYGIGDDPWASGPPSEYVLQHLDQYFLVNDLDYLGQVVTRQASQPAPRRPSPQGTVASSSWWVRGALIRNGTYGTVFLALNTTTSELLTIERVNRPAEGSREALVEALRQASETMKQFDHPHILRHLGFEETPSTLSIFSEYVPGGSLGSYIRKHGRLDEYVAKSFTGQILSGLEYILARGFVHKHLRPDNVLVDTFGVCKLSDYDIPKHPECDRDGVNEHAAFTAMAGSVFYMAPEVVAPKIDISRDGSKADIWSLGCVVLEMWTGKRPWYGQEAITVLLHLNNSTKCPPLPESVALSAEAEEFRMRCFAVDPRERPTAAQLQPHAYLELPPDWSFQSVQ